MISYYKRLLISLFSEINNIKDDPLSHIHEYKNVQETLITKISYIESRIRKLKVEVKETKNKLRTRDLKLTKKKPELKRE